MTPDHKCPRCGTLRPSGEVAHTCVVRDPADTGTSREGDPYAEIAALRAELERKDAALKLCEPQLAKLKGHIFNDLRGGCFHDSDDYYRSLCDRCTAEDAVRAALQPKEPPCKA